MEIKEYKFYRYESILDAIEAMNEHQEWHIVNVYPTGWRNEVEVVFYIKREYDTFNR